MGAAWRAPNDRQVDQIVEQVEAVAALNTFMGNGGIILIDTRNGGSGQGFAPGADAALERAAPRILHLVGALLTRQAHRPKNGWTPFGPLTTTGWSGNRTDVQVMI